MTLANLALLCGDGPGEGSSGGVRAQGGGAATEGGSTAAGCQQAHESAENHVIQQVSLSTAPSATTTTKGKYRTDRRLFCLSVSLLYY